MNETMYSYILEEQETCKRIIEERKEKLKPFLEILKNYKQESKTIIFLATGSSVNALNCAKYYIEKMLGLEVQIKMPSVFCDYETVVNEDSIFVAISQGGRSTSTIKAVKKALEFGAEKVVILTGSTDSPICQYSQNIIDINCGEEKVGYVTKGFTATVLTLMLMALEGAYIKCRINKDEYDCQIKKLEEVVSKIDECIKKTDIWYENNKKEFIKTDRVKTVGYGAGYGIALESNTKLAETARIAVSSFELEEYMHGPYLELKKDHLMIFLKTKGMGEEKLVKLAEYSKKTTDKCYTITYEEKSNDNKDLALGYYGDENLSTILFAIPIQILSYKLAEDMGIPLGVRIFTDFHSCLSSKL